MVIQQLSFTSFTQAWILTSKGFGNPPYVAPNASTVHHLQTVPFAPVLFEQPHDGIVPVRIDIFDTPGHWIQELNWPSQLCFLQPIRCLFCLHFCRLWVPLCFGMYSNLMMNLLTRLTSHRHTIFQTERFIVYQHYHTVLPKSADCLHHIGISVSCDDSLIISNIACLLTTKHNFLRNLFCFKFHISDLFPRTDILICPFM